MKTRVLLFILSVLTVLGVNAQAITISGTSSNTQNFNGLPTSGTVTWTNNSTVPSWYSSVTGNVTANAGTGNTAGLYSYGTGTNTDRAFGSINSNALGNIAYGVQLFNSTASAITNITVAYTGEQWRKENNANPDQILFYYRVYSSAQTTIDNLITSWTAVTALTFNAPISGATTATALDGNLAANRVTISAVTLPSLSLPAGSYIVLKWIDQNISGNDHGVSIDDVTVSWTVPSTPSLSATPATLTGFAATNPAASNIQTYTLTGSNLTPANATITVTAPANYEVSTDGTNFFGSVTPAASGGSLSQTISVRIAAGTPVSSPSGNVTNAGGGATTQNVAVSGTVTAPGATLTATPITLTGFTTTAGTASTSQSYALTGANLSPATGSITATAPTNYEVSADNITFGPTAAINYTLGTLTSVPVYVRISAGSAQGSVTGNVTHTGGSVSVQPSVALTGTVNPAPPAVVINKILNGNTTPEDAIELLVITNNADLRGMKFKDYSSNGNTDGGGVFQFTTNAVWNNVPSGTLIVIDGSSAATDITSSDFTLNIGRANTTYFTNNTGAFDIAQNDIVMLKASGSSDGGSTGAISTIAVGSANGNANYTGAPGYKINTNASQITAGSYAIATNATSALIDFNAGSTGAAISATEVFLEPNNTTNETYICTLRGGNSQPTTAASGFTFPTVTTGSIQANWTNGNGARRIVVARLTTTTAVAPTDGVVYTPSTNFTVPGAPNGTTGTGNVVVFDGTGSTVTLTNLAANTNYTFDVYEYNGSTFCRNYFPTAGSAAQTTSAGGNTTVQFTAGSATVAEAVGTTTLTLIITNPSPTVATTIEVAITGGTGTAADVNSYTTQTVTFPANSSANETVTLTVTNDVLFESNETIVFTLQNISGGQGTPTIGTPNAFTLTITDNDVPNIVINEINYNPDDAAGFTDANFEYIELYNNESVSVDISGYFINGAFVYTFPASTIMTAGQYIVLAINSASYPGSFQWNSGGGLVNSGETITLNTAGGLVVDAVTYGTSTPWPTSPNGSGPSLALTSPTLNNAVGTNWQSSCEANGTPGAVNTFTCNTLYSRASGSATTGAIWSFSPTGTAQTVTALGGFQTNRSIVVQTGHVVSLPSSINAADLTIQNNAQLWRNSTDTALLAYISIWGTAVNINGTFGNTNLGVFDGVSLNFEGSSPITVSGSGVINGGRFRKDASTNLTSSVNFNMSANSLFPATVLYNNASGGTTFNFTQGAGTTFNFNGSSSTITIDGTNGAGSGNRGGTFTFNGTVNVKRLLATNNNSATTTTFALGNAAVMNVDTVKFNLTPGTGTTVTFAAGARLNILRAAQLISGTQASTGNIVMKSNASGTGYIDNFSSGFTGSISGTVTFERFSGGTTGFRYLSMPINNPSITEISEIGLTGPNNGQIIPLPTCSNGAIASNSPYGNVMEWREAGPFNLAGCRQSGWWVRSAGTLETGRGYLVRVPQNSTTTVTGTPNLTTVTYANLLNLTTTEGNGNHLMGNPYAAPYRWNTDITGFGDLNRFNATGAFVGTFTPVVITSPINDRTLPIFGGFFIRRQGPGALSFSLPATNRVAAHNVSYQDDVNYTNLHVVVSGNGFADQTRLYFLNEATSNYETAYDARKMEGTEDQPLLYTHLLDGTEQLGINGLGLLTQQMVIPMVFKAGQNGTFNLNFDNVATFSNSAMVYLEDKQLGTLTDVRANANYEFNSNVNDNPERFAIRFEPGVQANVTNQTCDALGSITLTQNGGTVWASYTVVDNNGVTYATGNNFNGTAIINNLTAQEYIVTLTSADGYTTQEFITVNGTTPLELMVEASAEVVVTNQAISLTATAVNATSYTFNYGDGVVVTTSENVVNHTYTQAGTYNVIVIATNGVCETTYTKTITVNTPTSVNNINASGITTYANGGKIVVEFNNFGATNATVNLYSADGKLITTNTNVSTLSGKYFIATDALSLGYYLVNVVGNGKSYSSKLLITNN